MVCGVDLGSCPDGWFRCTLAVQGSSVPWLSRGAGVSGSRGLAVTQPPPKLQRPPFDSLTTTTLTTFAHEPIAWQEANSVTFLFTRYCPHGKLSSWRKLGLHTCKGPGNCRGGSRCRRLRAARQAASDERFPARIPHWELYRAPISQKTIVAPRGVSNETDSPSTK